MPAHESVGIDPNTFATATYGLHERDLDSGLDARRPNSPEDIVAGPYEGPPVSSASGSIVTCTGRRRPRPPADGCTTAGGAVSSGDDLVQVIATATGFTTGSQARGQREHELDSLRAEQPGRHGRSLCIDFTNTRRSRR